MELSMPYCKDDDLKPTKKISSSLLFRSKSTILNLILLFVLCLFISCFYRFISHDNQISIIEKSTPLPVIVNDKPKINIDIPRKRSYYDFEPFINNTSLLKPANKTRRFFYIDLGCFDGRDIDYFIHFHLAEVSRLGQLNVIAFEPDPINFSACKLMQQRRTAVKGTVYDAAVWTETGKVPYATEKGQKSRVDQDSVLYVRSIDFSRWLIENFRVEDYVYVKFTIEGAEIPILEKMIIDESLKLVDHLEVEWDESLSPDLEPRRVFLECMFDNFGMDFLYMINPVDSRHAFILKDSYASVPKDRGWRLNDPLVRFHYKTRKDISALVAERLQKRSQQQASS